MKLYCKNCFSCLNGCRPRRDVVVAPPQSWTDGKGVVLRTCPECGYSQQSLVDWDDSTGAPARPVAGWGA